jgi:hypothetical protein
MKKAASKPKPHEPLHWSAEVFGRPYLGSVEHGNNQSPSAFNGTVRFRRYRVSVDEIDEPDQVLIDRLRKLWAECDNHHNLSPIQQAAAQFGIELKHEDRKRP